MWLSKTQCVLCHIKVDYVRPVHLWGTNRYWPKLPVNAKQMVDSTTSCWETWLPFSARWSAAALASRCPHVSQRTLAALNKTTSCSASGPRDHRTWPFVTFSFGGTWRTESMYLHYLQPWMSCRNASLQLSTRSRWICCRVWSEQDYRVDVCRVTRGEHIECVWYHMKLYEFMQM